MSAARRFFWGNLPFLALIGLLAGCNLLKTAPPPPTPVLPAVQFQNLQNNSRVVEGIDLAIDLLATDAGTGVARVDLLVDGQLYQSATPEVSPTVPALTLRMHWLAAGIGFHSLSAIAYRADGTRGDEMLISIEVVARNS